jgi:cytochrome c-type biogenesis protein CcmH/NrfG
VAEQLRELTALHKDGILTDEEFQAKRAELVKRL